MSNVTYSPSHRQAGTPVINTQSSLRMHPMCVKNVALAVLFGSNGNSYTMYTVRYVYVYTCCLQYRDAGRAKEIKIWDSSEYRVL